MLALLALVAVAPVAGVPVCLKEGTLGKDPFLPAPNMYVANWGECAKQCGQSFLCKEFAFKADTTPPGGCWLFNKVDVNFVEDPQAKTGDKTCQDPEAEDSTAAAATGALAAANVASAAVPALSDSADAAVGSGVASGDKALVAQPGAGGQDHTVLYCVLGGTAAAGLIAAGGWAMMPAKRKRKRSAKADKALMDEESPAAASSAPSGGLEMEAPAGYLQVPQAYAPAPLQYVDGQYMAYQPYQYQQPMAYQPMAYQYPSAMEPTTYMPTTPA